MPTQARLCRIRLRPYLKYRLPRRRGSQKILDFQAGRPNAGRLEPGPLKRRATKRRNLRLTTDLLFHHQRSRTAPNLAFPPVPDQEGRAVLFEKGRPDGLGEARIWDAEIAGLPSHREFRFWLATGLLLPVGGWSAGRKHNGRGAERSRPCRAAGPVTAIRRLAVRPEPRTGTRPRSRNGRDAVRAGLSRGTSPLPSSPPRRFPPPFGRRRRKTGITAEHHASGQQRHGHGHPDRPRPPHSGAEPWGR